MRFFAFIILFTLSACTVQKEFYNMIEADRLYEVKCWQVKYDDSNSPKTTFYFVLPHEDEIIIMRFEEDLPSEFLAEFTSGQKNPSMGGGDLPESLDGHYTLKESQKVYTFKWEKNKKEPGPITIKAVHPEGFSQAVQPVSCRMDFK